MKEGDGQEVMIRGYDNDDDCYSSSFIGMLMIPITRALLLAFRISNRR